MIKSSDEFENGCIPMHCGARVSGVRGFASITKCIMLQVPYNAFVKICRNYSKPNPTFPVDIFYGETRDIFPKSIAVH